MSFFKERLDFFKENRQIGYSIFLLIAIPLIIALNTFFISNNLVSTLNYELRLKAELATSIIKIMAKDNLEDEAVLQESMEEITKQSLFSTIKSIKIVVPENENFKILASSEKSEKGKVLMARDNEKTSGYKLALSLNEPIATLKKDEKGEYWSIFAVIENKNKEKVGIVDVQVSTVFIQDKVDITLSSSLALLSFSVLVVFLLILNNAKLFQYSVLFRKLQEVDKMKDEFISVANHELRTPLATIKGFLSLLVDGKTTMSKKELIDRAMKSATRLEELVNDLLDVSRIEQGRMTFELTETDIASIITDLIKEYSISAKQKKLKLKTIIPENFPKAMVDADRFKQIMINLIGNAIKYTPSGEVSVVLECNTKQAKIIVKDTGVGMSEEDRERLFTKFYRIRTRETEKITGTGLGLWITKEMVEKMGGKISVDSIPGTGSQFTVEFPLTRQ